jgi:hypothetical protein
LFVVIESFDSDGARPVAIDDDDDDALVFDGCGVTDRFPDDDGGLEEMFVSPAAAAGGVVPVDDDDELVLVIPCKCDMGWP